MNSQEEASSKSDTQWKKILAPVNSPSEAFPGINGVVVFRRFFDSYPVVMISVTRKRIKYSKLKCIVGLV